MVLLVFLLVLPDFSQHTAIEDLVLSVSEIVIVILTILLIYYKILPLFKIENVEYQSLKSSNFLITILMIFILVYTIDILITIIAFYLLRQLGLPEIQAVTSDLSLNDPFLFLNIIILFISKVITSPILEETISRRITIPFLEKKGISPILAVIASSIAFGLAHIPNAYVYKANLTYIIIIFIFTFIGGLFLGIIYIYTRNIFYPIIIHSMVNFLSVSAEIIELLGEPAFMIGFDLVIAFICIIGVLIILMLIWKYYKNPDHHYLQFLKE